MMMDDFGKELQEFFLDSFGKYLSEIIVNKNTIESDIGNVLTQLKEFSDEAVKNNFNYLGKYIYDVCNEFAEHKVDSTYAVERMRALQRYVLELRDSLIDSQELLNRYNLKPTTSGLYLRCTAGINQFVVPIKNVVEVISNREIFKLPVERSDISGFLTFRGESIPVINLAYIGLTKLFLDGDKYSFIICEVNEVRFSFQVTQISEVISIADNLIQKFEQDNKILDCNYVTGCLSINDRNVLLFNLERLIA